MLRMMAIVCNFIVVARSGPGDESSPDFLSRFDYDYKVLPKLLELDNKLKQVLEYSVELDNNLKQVSEYSVELDNQLKQVSESSELERAKLRQKLEDQQLEIEKLIAAQEDETAKSLTTEGTSSSNTYVRWGKTSCPGNGTQHVYSGYAGRSWYRHSGAAVDYICLPKHPHWNKYKDWIESLSAYVFGAEYELDQRDLASFFDNIISGEDVPCAVCSTDRSSVLMIPGRNQCYGGWTVEFHGYLASGAYNQEAASQYVCLDNNPESIPGSASNTDGKLFYLVKGRCGSLPCPPYAEVREPTRVVRSK